MKLLLDECIPKRLRLDFPGHEVITVEEAGLTGLKNGELLSAASVRFDVLITVDQHAVPAELRNLLYSARCPNCPPKEIPRVKASCA